MMMKAIAAMAAKTNKALMMLITLPINSPPGLIPSNDPWTLVMLKPTFLASESVVARAANGVARRLIATAVVNTLCMFIKLLTSFSFGIFLKVKIYLLLL